MNQQTQTQLRDGEVVMGTLARRLVSLYMTDPEACIIDGAFAGCRFGHEVAALIHADDTFRLQCTDCGVQLELIDSKEYESVTIELGGMRRDLDALDRWVAVA